MLPSQRILPAGAFTEQQDSLSLFVRWIEVIPEDLVHSEHMDLILFEDCFHGPVAEKHPFIIGVLEIMLLDVSPDAFDCLGSGQLRFPIQ